MDRYAFGGVMFSFFYEYERLMRHLSSKSGLYSGQPRVITVMHEHPGCTLSELSELIGVGMPSLSVSVRNMRKSGLVTMEGDRAKGRRLYLTEEGLKKAENFDDIFDGFLQRFLDAVGQENEEAVDAQMRRMVDIIHNYCKEELEEEEA